MEQKARTSIKRWSVGRFYFRRFETGWLIHYNCSHMASYWRKPVAGMPKFKLNVGKLRVEYF